MATFAGAQNNAPTPLTLPATGSMFATDVVNGKTSLVELRPSDISANHHAGKNFVRGLVAADPRNTLELAGASSATTLHTSHSTIYMRLSSDDPALTTERLTLLRVKPVDDHRVVATMRENIVGGHRERQQEEVPIRKGVAQGTSWLKVMPEAPLAPGEYAVVFAPKDTTSLSTKVYDFNVVDASK